MKNFTEVVMWFFVGCIVVLVVTHAPGFAQAVTAVGGEVQGMGTILTGTNVTNSVYSKQFTG